jgi:hypothetical protein
LAHQQTAPHREGGNQSIKVIHKALFTSAVKTKQEHIENTEVELEMEQEEKGRNRLTGQDRNNEAFSDMAISLTQSGAL